MQFEPIEGHGDRGQHAPLCLFIQFDVPINGRRLADTVRRATLGIRSGRSFRFQQRQPPRFLQGLLRKGQAERRPRHLRRLPVAVALRHHDVLPKDGRSERQPGLRSVAKGQGQAQGKARGRAGWPPSRRLPPWPDYAATWAHFHGLFKGLRRFRPAAKPYAGIGQERPALQADIHLLTVAVVPVATPWAKAMAWKGWFLPRSQRARMS